MAYTNINGLFTGICDAIRLKGGSAGIINHQNIPDAILNISGGSVIGCDLGLIYLDPDPSKPSGGNNTSSGGNNNSGSISSNNNNGGGGGGNNNNSGPTGPRAKIYCSDNVYNMSYAFANFNYYQTSRGFFVEPACGNNVINFEGAYYSNYNISGPCAFGPNVYQSANNAYYNCANVWGSVEIPVIHTEEYGTNVSPYIIEAFWNTNLNGSASTGIANNLMGSFFNTRLTSVEIGGLEYGNNAFRYCNTLNDIIFRCANPDYSIDSQVISSNLRYSQNMFGDICDYDTYRTVNVYTFNTDDYLNIKTNSFKNNVWGSSANARTFGDNVVFNSPTTMYVPWNIYNVYSESWENTYKEMNVIQMASSTDADGSGGNGPLINLYLAQE